MSALQKSSYDIEFRIITDKKSNTFYIEKKSTALFSRWKKVYEDGLMSKPLIFTEYVDAIHWIEHQVCQRVGVVIHNSHYRD